MGKSATQHNTFWQLFFRPVASNSWQLVTPPGTADNGGLVLARSNGHGLVTGFRPSQDLTFSPLIETSDGGRDWSSLSPLDAPLASTPDALAVKPGTGQLLALVAGDTIQATAPGKTGWTILVSQHALASTPAGRACGLQELTAVTYTPAGIPIIAGTCIRPGTAGIFTVSKGSWQAAGPPVPAALAGQDITVSRLIRTDQGMTALLVAGTGPRARLFAAWSTDAGQLWTVSLPLPLHGADLTTSSFGPGGTAAIITSADRGEIITSPGSSWRPLPPLPPGTATLAPGANGTADALAVDRGRLTVWQLSSAGTAWTRVQLISVPIPYGSSA
jgi:hypothetical protein